MKTTTRNIVLSAMIAAIYAIMTIIPPFSMLSYGLVQFRISEVLMLLCLFSPCAVWGCFIGCLLANLFTPLGVNMFDVIFGSFATLSAGFVLYKFRNTFLKHKLLSPIPVILFNAIIVGLYLPILLGGTTSIFDMFAAINDGTLNSMIAAGGTPIIVCMISVGIGEGVVTYLLGIPFCLIMQKHNFFKTR